MQVRDLLRISKCPIRIYYREREVPHPAIANDLTAIETTVNS